MYKNLLIVIIVLCSCVIKPTIQKPNILPKMPTTLPIHPKEVKLDENITKDGNWSKSLEAGSCITASGTPVIPIKPCPADSGVLLSEEAASRAYLYKISYEEIRSLYTYDQILWDTEQKLYEKTIRTLQDQNEELQPTWFQENGFALGVGTGIILSVSGLFLLSKAK